MQATIHSKLTSLKVNILRKDKHGFDVGLVFDEMIGTPDYDNLGNEVSLDLIEKSISWLKKTVIKVRFHDEKQMGFVRIGDRTGKDNFFGHSAFDATISVLNGLCLGIKVPYSFDDQVFWAVYDVIQPVLHNCVPSDLAGVYDLNHRLLMDFGSLFPYRVVSLQNFIALRSDWLQRYLEKKDKDAGRIILFESEVVKLLTKDKFSAVASKVGLDKILSDYGVNVEFMSVRSLPRSLPNYATALIEQYSYCQIVDAAKRAEKLVCEDLGAREYVWTSYNLYNVEGDFLEIPF